MKGVADDTIYDIEVLKELLVPGENDAATTISDVNGNVVEDPLTEDPAAERNILSLGKKNSLHLEHLKSLIVSDENGAGTSSVDTEHIRAKDLLAERDILALGKIF